MCDYDSVTTCAVHKIHFDIVGSKGYIRTPVKCLVCAVYFDTVDNCVHNVHMPNVRVCHQNLDWDLKKCTLRI